MIPDSLKSHFLRWAKLEYMVPDDEDGHPTGLDVQIMFYEEGSITFEELKEVINARDADWESKWEYYKNYNRI